MKAPPKVFNEVVRYFPMICADLVVEHEGKVLLLYRENEPERHKWFIFGGRVYKGESLEEAAIRKAKEEAGLDVEIVRQLPKVYDTRFPEAVAGINGGTHTFNIVFIARPKGRPEVRLNEEHSAFKWVSGIEKGLHPYVKEALRDSGVFGDGR